MSAHEALLPGYVCHCRLCRWKWEARCECQPIRHAYLDTEDYGLVRVKHRPECKPPDTCAKCKAAGWNRPPRKAGRPVGS